MVNVFERLDKNYSGIEKSQDSKDYCDELRWKKRMEDIAAYNSSGTDMEIGELVADGGVDDGLEDEIWRVKSRLMIIVMYDSCLFYLLPSIFGFLVN